MLVYKNEMAMSLEMLSSKLQDAVSILEEYNRAPYDRDIVENLWNKIQNPDLNLFVEALNVQYSQNLCEYKLFFQDIAAKIPILRRVTFKRNVSEVMIFSKSYTIERMCPTNGVFNAERKFLI